MCITKCRINQLYNYLPSVNANTPYKLLKTTTHLLIASLAFASLAWLMRSNPNPLDNSSVKVANSESYVSLFLERWGGYGNVECTNYVDWLQQSDQSAVAKTIDKLQECPKAKELWEKINKKVQVAVVEMPASVVPTGRILSNIDTILLGDAHSDEDRLYWLLYEAHNLSRKNAMLALQEKANQGLIPKEDFAKQMEEIEFGTNLSNYYLNKECIDEQYWQLKKPELFLLDKPLTKMTFETWWKLIKTSDHTENLRSQWKNAFKDVYCHKHPKAKDCLK